MLGLLGALGVAACGGRHLGHGVGDQPDGGAGGGDGVSETEGMAEPSPGGQAGDSGSEGGAGGHLDLGGAGADAGVDVGGAGVGNQAVAEEEMTVVLEATVKSTVGASAFVTDVSLLAGYTFELRDCIGPYEPRGDGPPFDRGSAWIDDPDSFDWSYDVDHPPFCPKLTLHLIAVGAELALIVEMPTQTFPYAERLELERRGEVWLAKGIATSTRLALRNEDPEWATDYYKAALAVFAFADDDQDGDPERVVTAATNSVEGSLLVGGEPFHTYYDEFRRIGWVNWGKAEGVALSQGAPPQFYRPITATELTTHGVFINEPRGVETLDTPGFPPDRARYEYGRFEEYVALGGSHHVFALTAAVSADSVFHFENAQGEQSTLTPISIRPIEGYETNGRYIHGFVAADGLSGDWELVGQGTRLDGKRFTLRQSFSLHDSIDVGAGGASSQ